MDLILQQIAALPAKQRALLAERNPLSFSQETLWFLHQVDPTDTSYNLQYMVGLKGLLDTEALGRSLKEVVRRHESLRTRFPVVDSQPIQLVSAESFDILEISDLSDVLASRRDSAVDNLRARLVQQPFDLSTGPLLRACLIRLSHDEHVLLLVMHHIVTDGWSTRVLVQELQQLYEAFAAGRPSPLTDLPIQYRDYALWQREYLQGEILKKDLAYWKEQLAGAPEVLELPADRPRPAVQRFCGASEPFVLDEDLTWGLQALSARESTTLFMTMWSAFVVLLYRYTGVKDIVIGTPIANRRQRETEKLIGFFVNMLVLRTEVRAEESYLALLRRARETALEAYEHQDLPFEKLVEELRPVRSLSHNPLFQVLFEVQHAPRATFKLPNLEMMPLVGQTTTTKFDLILTVTETPGGTVCVFTYNTDLFERATILRMVDHFKNLLSDVVAYPEKPVSALSLLTEMERQQIFDKWNDTKTDYCFDKSLPQLCSEQARRTPEAVALVFEEEELTYRELNEKANEVARSLMNRGVAKNTFVPVLMDRSTELVIAWLAIMKAGAAFIPLDTNWPVERLRRALNELNSSLILINKESAVQAEQLGEIPTLLIESPAVVGLTSDPPVEIAPSDPIYAIYTSGSSGKPKAAVVAHGGIINRLFWMNDFFGREAATVSLLTTRPVYDGAVWEIFWPLINGGKTVIPPPQMETTATDLTSLIAGHGVTILDLFSSALDALVPQIVSSAGLRASLQSLRHVVIGGEEVNSAMAYKFAELLPNIKITNLYGPTEASIGCICYQLTTEVKDKIPIGKPISNVQVLILDHHLNPVPVGVPGEIYLSGICVGLGYLNDKEQTRAAFIDNPFPEFSSRQLYKTGDRARYLRDGNIDYLGRLDRQVKLRGLRIELGEIEAVLREHETVSAAIVTVHEDGPGKQRIVAYVVAKPARQIENGELRTFLRERLPQYMVPANFISLEAMPLTSGGKIDRRALPPIADFLGAERQADYVAPRTPTEEVLAGIYSDVLKIEQVGTTDNFFELGGHSLLATQVVSRVRDAFGVELPLRSLFEQATLASLADEIDRLHVLSDASKVPPLVPVAQQTNRRIISFAQQRLWFLDQLDGPGSNYNIATVLRVHGTLDIVALERVLSEIVRRHEILRTRFVEIDGEPSLIISSFAELAVNLTDLHSWPSETIDDEIRRVVLEEVQRTFDLTAGSLLRCRLIRISAAEHVAVLTMHHIISDAWSMQVLVREISSLYEAFVRGAESPLEDLPIQYSDYALWQREWLQGDVLEEQLGYWRQQLDGLSTGELPTDSPRPKVQGHSGAIEQFRFSAEINRRLREIARQEGATLFMVLLAGFAILLWRYTGERDLAVGTPVANRTRREIEGLIGFFVNTLVLRIKVDGGESFRELVRKVKEVCLGAYAHQDVPFERVVEELNPERDLSRSPLFQVLFALQNAGEVARAERPQLAGLQLEPMNVHSGTAKFELNVTMIEGAEGLIGTVEYNTDIFKGERIKKLQEHYVCLMLGVTASPEAHVNSFPLMSETERKQVLFDWNAQRLEPGIEESVHELFEAQVQRTPEAVAVVHDGQSLSYRELNARANQLAHYLRRFGVGPEVQVGVLLHRSLEMVVALLGTLKAGGSYLPLDPDYPPDRLCYMLQDAQVQVVLTEDTLVDHLAQHSGHMVLVDRDCESISGESAENPASEVYGDNLAYVIYTSGSTGRPKGAMNTHEGIYNRLCWMQEAYGLTAEDSVLQKTPFSFDVSVWEFFWPLMTGARLVLARPGGHRDSTYLVQLIKQEQITTLHFVPAMLQVFLMEDGVEHCTSLRRVICSGEALSRELQDRFFARLSSVELHNLYGPTEAAVDVTAWACKPDGSHTSVPIGRPIANTQIYLLDEYQQPVPVGGPGELYIGGVQLARGYHKRPALTAERFVADPFSGQRGARLYRTGDLARYLSDGNIEYLGRLDYQVKIRGFRIELGEIEATLVRHEAVREAVLIAHEDSSGEKHLVAYLVPVAEGALSVSELRAYLKQSLPDYMVPATFVMLAALPLTANGKLDRKALPAPDQSRPKFEEIFVAPVTETQQILAEVWSDILGVKQIGINDNFFDLGGHSLLLVRVHAKLRQTFKQLSLVDLFTYPTVRSLANFLGQKQSDMTVDDSYDRAAIRKKLVGQRKLARNEKSSAAH